MKKVVNVSVGGRSFSLDEDAYARLTAYFDHFKARLDRDTQSAKEEVMADLENRRALYDRFMISQSVYQTDPWAELAAKPEDWAPIKTISLEAAE